MHVAQIPILVLTSLFLIPFAPAQAALPAVEDGSVAPANCWYTRGGCAARTGLTLTRPALAQPRLTWRFTVEEGGSVEGEPRVWHDVVLICEKRGTRRLLHCLELRTGKPFCRAVSFVTDVPLAPSIHERRVVVRSGEKRVTIYRLSRPVAEFIQEHEFEHPVSEPLMFGEQIYVCAGQLHRLAIGKPDPVWSAGRDVHSNLSLRNGRVYAIQDPDAGSTLLTAFNHFNGATLGAVKLEHAPAHKATGYPRIWVGAKTVLFNMNTRIPMRSRLGQTFINTFEFKLPLRTTARPANRCNLLADPCMMDDGWIGLETFHTNRVTWIKAKVEGRGVSLKPLARGQEHPELLKMQVPASTASAVVYLGNLAFDARRGLVLWRQGLGVVERPIPVRGGLLVVDRRDSVVYLRDHAQRANWRALVPSVVATRKLPSGSKFGGSVLVTGAGVQRRTTVTFNKQENAFSIGSGGRRREFQRADVALMIGNKKDLLYWGGTATQVANGLTAFIEKQVDEDFVSLAFKSLDTNDTRVIERYIAEISARGASEKDINKIKARLRRTVAHKLRIRPRYVAKLRAAEQNIYKTSLKRNKKVFAALVKDLPFAHALASSVVMLHRDPSSFDGILRNLLRFEDGLQPAHRLAMAGALLDGAPARVAGVWKWIQPKLAEFTVDHKIRLARWILDSNPSHAGATALVRELSPIKVPGVEKISALEWLDLLEATRDIDFEVVRLPDDPEEFKPSAELRELHKQTRVWRKDLVAIQSDRIVILTPAVDPGRIARCLAMGELLCDTLESMFAFSKRKRARALRLKILLFSSQEEYAKQSARSMGGHLAWTTGHYDANTRIARMFLPRGEGAFDSVMDVLAHELVHYWIDVQCPLFDHYDKRSIPKAPGFWIVEGFAGMFEGFTYDLRGRQVSSVKPSCRQLDVLANATFTQVLPWDMLFKLSQLGMHQKLSPKRGRNAVLTSWNMGAYPVLSHINMFYLQSAAACHFLYNAEGGKYRERLLTYLGDYYFGKYRALDVKKVFGLSPKDLGRRIVAYAKKVTAPGG